jgi:hypothetical protein
VIRFWELIVTFKNTARRSSSYRGLLQNQDAGNVLVSDSMVLELIFQNLEVKHEEWNEILSSYYRATIKYDPSSPKYWSMQVDAVKRDPTLLTTLLDELSMESYQVRIWDP